MTLRYVEVAVPVPLHQLYTYALPAGEEAAPGVRVRVPFGPHERIGVVISEPREEPPADLAASSVRAVDEVIDDAPVLSSELLRLARWLARYYHVPPGEAYLLPLPPGMAGRSGQVREPSQKSEAWARFLRRPSDDERSLGRKMWLALDFLASVGEAAARSVDEHTGADLSVLKRLQARGLVELGRRRVHRDPFAQLDVTPDTAPELTTPQRRAVDEIQARLGTFHGFLLHGVTGSGKTEVYLALIASVLARGQGALVLVPEIALTPQLVSRFRARLGDRVAVQHSGLRPDARAEQWKRIAAGELPVVIGARSALFAPLPDLGIIIVDEEHETSFKQDSSPRYNARDLALVRGQLGSAPVVLGSATPAAESWANVERGKLTRLSMPERILARPMPAVRLIDMRSTPSIDPDRMLSAPLVEALTETLERGEQAIVFLNRRGFAAFVLCRSCGAVASCSSCAVSFTWHRARQRLVCHYCDRTELLPPRCQACGDDALSEVGFGTERVEAVVSELFPQARVGRMDRDTTRGHALTRLLDGFRRRDIDVLIGTQMVAKGHDFPAVTLVGVLLAEQSLALPDFRASERTFQLMTQIAGRAGRATKPGRVLIQTYLPDHYALRYALEHDTEGFLEKELRLRRDRGWPPATRLALFHVDGTRVDRTLAAANEVVQILASSLARLPERASITIQGPMLAPIERIKDRHRYRVLIRATSRAALGRLLARCVPQVAAMRRPRSVHVGLDVDPLSFL